MVAQYDWDSKKFYLPIWIPREPEEPEEEGEAGDPSLDPDEIRFDDKGIKGALRGIEWVKTVA